MVKFYVRMLLAAMLLVPSVAMAEDVTVLQVNYTDGTNVNFAFADKPVATIKADSVAFSSAANSVKTDMSQLKNFKFITEGEATGIHSVKQGNAQISAGNAYLSNLRDGETVRVFTVGGQQVLAVKAVDGSASLDLNHLGRGVFIIRTATTSTKVLVK